MLSFHGLKRRARTENSLVPEPEPEPESGSTYQEEVGRWASGGRPGNAAALTQAGAAYWQVGSRKEPVCDANT